MKVIGLISGTSVDGIDAALVELTGVGYNVQPTLLATQTADYSTELRDRILAICGGKPLTMADIASLDDEIAIAFANTANQLGPADLIASHGQTIYHRPPTSARMGYSWQLGRGELIAALTKTPTVSDFRHADIAAGGHGAPLVPPVDASLLSHPHHHRCVQNIGGIGNLTYLPPWDKTGSPPQGIVGWDTGPGNALIDWAVHAFSQGKLTYDHNGDWAAQGTPCQRLIDRWLTHPFFRQPPPKSTGRELFGADYGHNCWQEAQALGLSQADFLATLTDFTATTIVDSYRQLPRVPDEVLLCGGGSKNGYLRSQLQVKLPDVTLLTTDDIGLDSGFKEAIAFAILGYWRWHQHPGNLLAVTGASYPCQLGQIEKMGVNVATND
ncbi:anhydro-N-acetylmuramic acid kinase [Leptolyngbya cf. ectocarpi LEGE 11479]|uniref:Anhydro-N-acetylmuramic acid kinase n=1 Tax=Leptolyngbya cf. ectocarpi LEGE 11479 TaxID=1828722 RepID=A0A928X0M0_LEPEC|nr:anhydro-N-acetylmuramic acid kinase [Leptolyngbya ectocarpi]MBE9066819.1 anhydro-N-acetylmuramic acid kinase [Leptolyngbya cf. ectocarpi LEGE 11479]